VTDALVHQRHRIGEAASEDWQQHTDQQGWSVHDDPPWDDSWSAELFAAAQLYHGAAEGVPAGAQKAF